MKKFGLGKKDKSSEDDPSRSRLFGKSKSKGTESPAAPSNPYATQQPSQDSYARQSSSNPYAQQAKSDPYTQPSKSYDSSGGYGGLSPAPYGKNGTGRPSSSLSQQTQPPPYQSSNSFQSDRSRNDKSPVPQGGYGGSRYGNSGYGQQQGYGDNRYGGSGDAASIGSSRPGGYGGMGGAPSSETLDTETGKDELFGGANQRFEQRQAQGLPPEEDPAMGKGYGAGGGAVPDMGYGTYQDRQLTAEEEEEEDVQATKQQIRALKQQDVSSTRNALRIAEQAEQTGRETLERLGAQGERIHNTEKNLDLAHNQNRLAEEKARELKHLNRSMWAMHVGNPFGKGRRERERDDMIISQHHSERQEREATRAAAYQSSARRDEQNRELKGPSGATVKKGNLAERSKYQFEADSDDEQMEDEIDQNLDTLGGAAKRLNQLGRAMGDEVDNQNKHIDRIVGKADRVDDGILMNRSRLDRIK